MRKLHVAFDWITVEEEERAAFPYAFTVEVTSGYPLDDRLAWLDDIFVQHGFARTGLDRTYYSNLSDPSLPVLLSEALQRFDLTVEHRRNTPPCLRLDDRVLASCLPGEAPISEEYPWVVLSEGGPDGNLIVIVHVDQEAINRGLHDGYPSPGWYWRCFDGDPDKKLHGPFPSRGTAFVDYRENKLAASEPRAAEDISQEPPPAPGFR